MTICLTYPASVTNAVVLEQFTNIQRGVIFIWFIFIFVLFIITGVRLVAGKIDSEEQNYKDQKQAGNQSQQKFDQAIIDNQKMEDEDGGSVKSGKIINKLETITLPFAITFALNLSLGVNYSFCFVLFFLALIPMILFNVLNLHKKFCSHRVIIAMGDNLYLLATFFWLVNIWTTGKYMQPYYIRQVANSTTCQSLLK